MITGRGLDEHGLFLEAPDAIVTYTGRVIRPLAPEVDDIDIEDIAHALSLQCRFAGHSTRFLSVAEHSVNVAHQVPEFLRLEALLHDASEAYISDIPKPIKESPAFDQYRLAEARLEAAVQRKFRLPLGPWDDEIKMADRYMFLVEAAVLCPQGVGRYVDVDYSLFEEPRGYPPRMAEGYFLDMFYHYWAVRERQKEAL